MMNIRVAADELEQMAQYEGSEIGEMAMALCKLAYYAEYVGKEFSAALEKEVQEQLQYFKENATITEQEETFTRKVKVFEWNE